MANRKSRTFMQMILAVTVFLEFIQKLINLELL